MAQDLFVGLLFVLCFSAAYSASGAMDNFSIKPDNQKHVTDIKLDDSTVCTFTYSASGGTNEEWQILLAMVNKNEKIYTCKVNRAEEKASYLYFKRFSVEIVDKDVLSTEVFDSSGSALLQDEEYVVSGGRVKSKRGGFRNSLSKLSVSSK